MEHLIKKLEAVSSLRESSREIEEVSGEKMSINHPIFDEKFDQKQSKLKEIL